MNASRRTPPRPASAVPAGVAAGHPATAEAAAAILRAGGSAADAAVAAVLAACVAETVFTGLGGGGFATYYDAATGEVTCLDFFVAVPGLGSDSEPGPMTMLSVAFGDVPQAFSIGAPSVAVPGVPAGCAEVHRRWGRLPWAELVAPALCLAKNGVLLPPTHATVLGLIAGGLAVGDGAAVYAPDGTLAVGGATLQHPGLDRMLEMLMEEGPAAFYRGPVAQDLVDVVAAGGGVLTADDLAAYAVHEVTAGTARFGSATVRARTDLNRCRDAFAALPGDLADLPAPSRAAAVAAALGGPDLLGDTTNVSVVDADGNACVVTTTMGLGSGVWVPGLGVHLNSMLGEGELLIGPQVPGARMGSMMCPLVVVDDDHRLVAAAGAAGASRIRTALVHSVVGATVEGLPADVAVARPRTHPVGPVLHVEPGLPAEVEEHLRAVGWVVQKWPRRDAYFGGASMVGRTGAGADPRRDGAALLIS